MRWTVLALALVATGCDAVFRIDELTVSGRHVVRRAAPAGLWTSMSAWFEVSP